MTITLGDKVRGILLLVIATATVFYGELVRAHEDHLELVATNLITVRGKVEITVIDDVNLKKSQVQYALTDENGKRWSLHFKGKAPGHLLRAKKAELTARVIDSANLYFGKDDGTQAVTLEAAGWQTQTVSGQINTILVHITSPSEFVPYCSFETVRDHMFGSHSTSVSNAYRTKSNGLLSLNGSAYAITLPSTAYCGTSGSTLESNVASALLANYGVSLSAYTERIYVLDCRSSGGGVGTVGGYNTLSNSYIFGPSCDQPGIYAHEIGHNLGMYHSGSYSTGGTISTYGDQSDFMGNAALGPGVLNPIHMHRLGWLPPQSLVTSAANNNSSYNLTTLDDLTSLAGTRVLKILKEDTSEYYYVSYRTRAGFSFNMVDPVIDRINVYLERALGTYSGNTPETIWIASLLPGESFTDAVNNLSITAGLRDANQMSVSIADSVAEGACLRSPPSVILSPAFLVIPYPEYQGYFTAQVVNNDSASCPSSTFVTFGAYASITGLSLLMPPINNTYQSNVSLTLAPGAAATIYPIEVRRSGLPAGTHTIDVVADDQSIRDHRSGQTLSVEIQGPPPGDTVAPSITIKSPLSGVKVKGASLKISVTATDNVGVKKVELYVNGQLSATSTVSPFSFSIKTNLLKVGTNSLQVKAYDAAGNVGVSPIVNVMK